MKHFFTISLCFLALSLSAQEPDGICCDPDGTNYTFINCLQSGCCGLYDNDGCVEDPDCSNYNPSAGCLSYCEGQFDECGICNGPGAIYDCGCSEMPEGDCDCFGNELDACGECGGDNACLGCMISLACNYDPAATVNDGSCEFLSCLNFGCNDPLACNYDTNADYNDGTCVYANAPYDCNGNCVEDTDGDGVCDVYETYGCTDTTACNYNDTVTEDDGNCTYAVAPYDCFGLCVNDTDGDGLCDELEVSGCTDVEACNYDNNSTDFDNSICEYAEPNYDCDGNCLNDSDGDGICDELEVLGCSDVDACNYSPEATDDDGSCDYTCCPGPGCCSIGHYWDWELEQCFDINPTDTNLDGCTDLNDLMDILSAYGDCAEVNYSLSFDGVDDYVEGSASSSLDVTNTNNITLSAWVKPNDFNGSQRIITHTAEGSDHQQYSLHVSDGQIYFISGASLFEQNGFNLSSSNLELGVWNNISMTYDGSAVRLYLDGNIVFEKLEPDYFPSDWMGYFYIGKRADGEEQFNGYIDEVSIWNSALTQEQIQSYMSTPPTGNEEGLVGYWDFNEGTGSTLTDQTSNGNDGIINGATWSTDVPTAP
jgi:hypothetical protein